MAEGNKFVKNAQLHAFS